MDVTSNDDPRRDAMLRRDSRTAAPGAKRTLVPAPRGRPIARRRCAPSWTSQSRLRGAVGLCRLGLRMLLHCM